MTVIRLLRQQRRDNYIFLVPAPMLPDAGGGLITSSFIDPSVRDASHCCTGETCFPLMKSYRIVPRAPDDETPVDFPDETSLRGDQLGVRRE